MYIYLELKPKLFTENGQVMFIKVRDNIKKLLELSGAVSMSKAISSIGGDSWELMACVDRLVELKEIKEITGDNVAGQHRVFVKY